MTPSVSTSKIKYMHYLSITSSLGPIGLSTRHYVKRIDLNKLDYLNNKIL